MSRIEKYRNGNRILAREMWDRYDIAEYCGISEDNALKLLIIANRACGGAGYADIAKDTFVDFMNEVDAKRESSRLQDEANAASIVDAKKNRSQNWITSFIAQAIALIK